MRMLFISAAVLQFLSAATAQTASAESQSASLDQRDQVAAIVRHETTRPLTRLELLAPHETLLALPLVTLRLLMTGLIGGATSESGIASTYAGGLTSSGEKARPGGASAAHRSIAFGTMVRVTNRANGKSVIVRINDRGPFVRGRIIDLMPATARKLGFSGLTPVTIVIVSLP